MSDPNWHPNWTDTAAEPRCPPCNGNCLRGQGCDAAAVIETPRGGLIVMAVIIFTVLAVIAALGVAAMITLALPYPISANRYWASRVIKAKTTGQWMAMTYVTPEAKAYKESIGWIARQAGVRQPLSGRIRLHAELFPHRPLDWQRRMRKLGEAWDDTVQCIDLGNAEKVMSDALQGIVFADDCMYRRIVLDRMEPDDRGARLMVHIEQVQVAHAQGELLDPATIRDAREERSVPF